MIDQNVIIADTGYLYALINQNDPKFFSAQKILDHYNDKTFITTCFVFAELYWLLRKKHFHLINKIFVAAGPQDIFQVVSFESSHLSTIKAQSDKYQNIKIDIADASLISLAEKIGHGNILTTDLGNKHKPCKNSLLQVFSLF